MHQPLLELIAAAYSGGTAKGHTAAIARHHRIQASAGYRDAARWVMQTLQDVGVDAGPAIETYFELLEKVGLMALARHENLNT